MLFASDRAGYRSHGSWGAEDDAYLMFFDLDAYNRFNMSKEEIEVLMPTRTRRKRRRTRRRKKSRRRLTRRRRRPAR